MKRKLFKSLLAVALICTGSNAWADVTTIYGRAVTEDPGNGYSAWSASDIGKGNWVDANGVGSITANGLNAALNSAGGSRSLINSSISYSENAILTYDIVWDNGSSYGNDGSYTYLKIGSVIQFKTYSQAQKGEVIIGENTINIPNSCGKNNGNRDGDVWTIHMVVNTALSEVSSLTVSGNKGTTKVNYTLASPVSYSSALLESLTLGWNRAASANFTTTLQSIRIQEEQQEVTTASYTINYKDGESIVKTVSGTSAVGAAITIESSFWKDDVKYFKNDGEPSSLTVASGGSTLDVAVSEAPKYNYTVNAVDASSNVLFKIADGSVYENENATVSYDAFYLKNDGNLLQANRINDSQKQYNYTFNVDTNNKVVTITYNNTSYSNVVFYKEAEDISALTEVGSGNVPVRCSGGKGAFAGSDAVITTLAPGKYQISGFAWGNAGTSLSINAGETLVATFTTAASTLNIVTCEEFTLNKTTDIIFLAGGNGGSSPKVLDYLFIQKTGEADEVLATITSVGWATLYTPYALNFEGTGLTAYTATVNGNIVKLTPVTSVPANTGVVLEGTPGDYSIPAIASSETAKGSLTGSATEATTYNAVDGNTLYVLAYDDARKVVQFQPVNEGSIAAGKAYLPLPTSSGVKALSVAFGTATGINAVESARQDGMMFNLAGQRVSLPARGLYIKNGKKVVVK